MVRRLANGSALLAVNPSSEPQVIQVPCAELGWAAGKPLREPLSGGTAHVGPEGLSLSLGPTDSVLLVD
jgi:hypothetical protein